MGASEKMISRSKRKKRIRKKIFGTLERPRLSVFKSAKHVYAQLIDDINGRTLVAASSMEKIVKEIPRKEKNGKIPIAQVIGKIIAERALDEGIRKVVFDRNGFLYHGRIKAISDGAREVGLEF